ncbi:unnamed protein product [Pieris brassicae]|uniref:DUF7775 domain-containing protein n=1 Tax=Pieris brassicae TaxID=7116 RepID=A0A9P0WT55_PIEBR|nr:unnamed protein product [Pieris brassicae]
MPLTQIFSSIRASGFDASFGPLRVGHGPQIRKPTAGSNTCYALGAHRTLAIIRFPELGALDRDLITISPASKYFLCVDLYAIKIAPLTDNVSEFGGGARVVWAMSAGDRETEAQGKKEEGSSSEDGRAATFKRNWCIAFRALELILAVIAIGLIIGALYAPQVVQSDHRHIALIYSAYSSFIIITGVLIIARIFGESAGWRTSLAFSILGVIMFTAAAAVIFYDWHRSYYANVRPNKSSYDLLISSGVFAVIDAAVFLLHAFLTFRKDADY